MRAADLPSKLRLWGTCQKVLSKKMDMIIEYMFLPNERIAYNGRVFNTLKAAKRGRFFAACGKGGRKLPKDKTRFYYLKGVTHTHRGLRALKEG